ncbi:uncharacterized protein [Watersipora subatra]|uniref:uncharacterized protein n=1 Tax=Watersipora subatra TaxID=2589382 RepID=UPI00355BB9E8
MLSTDQVLTPYDISEPLIPAWDASAYDLGDHKLRRQERLVALDSPLLSPSGRNCAQIKKKALSIIFWVISFTYTCMVNIPPMAAMRMQKCVAVLAAYNYDIKCKRSGNHAKVDAMTRSGTSIAMSMDPYSNVLQNLASPANDTLNVLDQIEGYPVNCSTNDPIDKHTETPLLDAVDKQENVLLEMVTIDEVYNSDDSKDTLAIVEDNPFQNKPQLATDKEDIQNSVLTNDTIFFPSNLAQQNLLLSGSGSTTAPTTPLLPVDSVNEDAQKSASSNRALVIAETMMDDDIKKEKYVCSYNNSQCANNQNASFSKLSMESGDTESLVSPKEDLSKSIFNQAGECLKMNKDDKKSTLPNVTRLSSSKRLHKNDANMNISVKETDPGSKKASSVEATNALYKETDGKGATEQEQVNLASQVLVISKATKQIGHQFGQSIGQQFKDDEKEEGEITSEDEVAPTISSSKETALRKARPPMRSRQQKGRIEAAKSLQELEGRTVSMPSLADKPDYSFNKMLLDYTEQRKKAKAEVSH